MTTPTIELQDGDELELVADPQPFLKITGTYAVANGRYDTISLELNVGPDEPPGDSADGAAAGPWFIDLVTMSIDALRKSPRPQAIVLNGPGVRDLFADRVVHADDCNGSCGVPADGQPATTDDTATAPAAEPAEKDGGS